MGRRADLTAENGHFLTGQPQRLRRARINAPAALATLTEAESAGEHCHLGALHRAHQVMFDWLDSTLPAA
ncbi:hypothetical protein [Streptomyces sp. NPDC001604]|uniref:hypothetical protein n=1 Tax=Streptomyces sp. NPDC001604 TaxID=3364593 RepID=UPI0036821F1A